MEKMEGKEGGGLRVGGTQRPTTEGWTESVCKVCFVHYFCYRGGGGVCGGGGGGGGGGGWGGGGGGVCCVFVCGVVGFGGGLVVRLPLPSPPFLHPSERYTSLHFFLVLGLEGCGKQPHSRKQQNGTEWGSRNQ